MQIISHWNQVNNLLKRYPNIGGNVVLTGVHMLPLFNQQILKC
jgi:hypothetical protein